MLANSEPIIPDWSRDRLATEYQTHPMFSRAMSLEELAFRAGINPTSLRQNIADYNRRLQGAQPDRFGRTYRPAEIATPPFYAIAMQGWTLVSFAGLSVNTKFQVLNPQREAISNLYAIGEVIGAAATSGAAYTNGMLVTPAITFGRLLGSALAKTS
jgi:fumarate reductase flavoprotein subunit